MARGRELRLGGEEGKKRGRMAGRLAWLAPQPPRDHAPGAPLGQVEEGAWRPSGHWLPVGGEGQQGGSSNVPQDPGDCEAVSRRAAALLLSFYGPLKESKNSDAVVTERYSIVIAPRSCVTDYTSCNGLSELELRSRLPPLNLNISAPR